MTPTHPTINLQMQSYPIDCAIFVVGRLSRGIGWYGFCDANPPYTYREMK